MGRKSYSELMKFPKDQLAYKLMACQVIINSHIEKIEQLLNTKAPVPVTDIIALTQDIEQVMENSPDINKAEAIAIMLCRNGLTQYG